MRKATVASLLILCGSTAAIAHVASSPADSGLQNWSANNTMDNSTTPTSPDTTTTPDTTTSPDTGTPPNASM